MRGFFVMKILPLDGDGKAFLPIFLTIIAYQGRFFKFQTQLLLNNYIVIELFFFYYDDVDVSDPFSASIVYLINTIWCSQEVIVRTRSMESTLG